MHEAMYCPNFCLGYVKYVSDLEPHYLYCSVYENEQCSSMPIFISYCGTCCTPYWLFGIQNINDVPVWNVNATDEPVFLGVKLGLSDPAKLLPHFHFTQLVSYKLKWDLSSWNLFWTYVRICHSHVEWSVEFSAWRRHVLTRLKASNAISFCLPHRPRHCDLYIWYGWCCCSFINTPSRLACQITGFFFIGQDVALEIAYASMKVGPQVLNSRPLKYSAIGD